jgi:large subunit ribosomal protein L13
MKTIFVKPAEAPRSWYIIDAKDLMLGKVAVKAASIVRGKTKAIYTPHQEVGDYVVIINADKIAVSGRKGERKIYYRHTGFPGGLKSNTFDSLKAHNPVAPLELAIKGMLPKGPLGRKLYKNVKIYAGEAHPHVAQNPQAVSL